MKLSILRNFLVWPNHEGQFDLDYGGDEKDMIAEIEKPLVALLSFIHYYKMNSARPNNLFLVSRAYLS